MADQYVDMVNAEFAIEEYQETLAEMEVQREAMEARLVELNSFRNRVKPFMWGLALIGVIKIGAWIIERCL
ncbi:hypothetical protein D3C85_1826310 [compost metagenome]